MWHTYMRWSLEWSFRFLFILPIVLKLLFSSAVWVSIFSQRKIVGICVYVFNILLSFPFTSGHHYPFSVSNSTETYTIRWRQNLFRANRLLRGNVRLMATCVDNWATRRTPPTAHRPLLSRMPVPRLQTPPNPWQPKIN